MLRKKGLLLLGVLISCLIIASFCYADYPLLTTTTYSADPSGLEYNGVLYSYWSNDDNNNGSYTMHQITCLSTTDLKHWTNNGQVFQVPSGASWAQNSWAPAVVYRNGYFWMYFANGGSNIGVAKSTSPTGPFTDAKGSAIVSGSTPGASGLQWCFDPAVLVDDDGQAYLYFGGGDNGSNARVIKLNSDMISVNGSAVKINAPNHFEDNWIHKYNGKYYYSYSTNSSTGMKINYMMSDNPMTGWVDKGTVMNNPPNNSNNNNHHSIFQYRGNWYIAYHNRYVAIQRGIDTTYKRNACLDQVFYNSDGTMKLVTCTQNGLAQLTTPTSGPTPTRGPTPTPTQAGSISIAAGSSSAVGGFSADQYYSGGSTYNNTNTIDVSQITSNPPPAALFNNERYGAMSYTIPGFTSGSTYTVTLYFAETYLTSSGSRLFNVSINGSSVLSNFDIYATAGGQNKAIARSFTTTANSSGQIVIQFTNGTENAKINGISIKPGGNNPTPTPTVVNTPTTGPTPTPTRVVGPTPTPTPGSGVNIAAGRTSALGNFSADQYYSGGSTYSNSNTVSVSGITSNPPPAALFNNERYGAMSYTIPGFAAGSSHTVTLYFAETYLTASGRRLFSVSINGTSVLSNFDIYAAAGGQNKAIARSFTATANASGQIVIQFTAGTENPKINGISIQ